MNNTRILTLSTSDVNNRKQQNPTSPSLQGEQTAGHFFFALRVSERKQERVRVAREVSGTFFPPPRAL